jgi:tRNA nucleotidyltransferase/poly(A) polymerase
MKAASIVELKKALVRLEQGELLEAVLRLARFKKDNKELLTYLLFLSKNEQGYVNCLCEEIDEQFSITPNAHKKTLRKLIRWIDKCLRFSGNKETEAQVRIHFCRALKASDTPFRSNSVMSNMYYGQIKKINAAIEKFHDDLKFEFLQELKGLK